MAEGMELWSQKVSSVYQSGQEAVRSLLWTAPPLTYPNHPLYLHISMVVTAVPFEVLPCTGTHLSQLVLALLLPNIFRFLITFLRNKQRNGRYDRLSRSYQERPCRLPTPETEEACSPQALYHSGTPLLEEQHRAVLVLEEV